MKHLSKFSYDCTKHDWINPICQLYGISDLSRLHEYLPGFNSEMLSGDSSSLLHKIFYSNFDISLKRVYISFLQEILPIIGEPFYYQKIPNIRFGLPGNSWLSRFHTDAEYNHPQGELNINLAVTSSFGTLALQIEEKPGGTIKPLIQNYGEFTFIDHLSCLHGTVINNEGKTLVSLDFRIIPISNVETFSDASSIVHNIKFTPGHYYSEASYG